MPMDSPISRYSIRDIIRGRSKKLDKRLQKIGEDPQYKRPRPTRIGQLQTEIDYIRYKITPTQKQLFNEVATGRVTTGDILRRGEKHKMRVWGR